MSGRSQAPILVAAGLAVAVLIAALALMLRTRSQAAAEMEAERAAAEEARHAELAVVQAPGSRERLGTDATATEDTPAPAQPTSAAVPAPTAPARPPKDAQGTLKLTVLDALTDAPVPLARVEFIGLRREDDLGSEYAWPGEHPRAETDVRGMARLPFPAWVRGLALTRKIDTSVSHPDYVALRQDLTIESLEQEAVVRLARGAFLIVSGWIGSPSNVVRNVTPLVEYGADLDAGSWQPMRDGRPSTNRLAPGPHTLAITWSAPDSGLWHSLPDLFTLAAGEQRELSLELLPATTLEGSLDPLVPRPVVNGEVEVRVEFGGSDPGLNTLRAWRAKVEPDGSFRIAGLPPGSGEIIALCEGWVAHRGLPEDHGGPMRRLTENPLLTIPPKQPVVVPMEPTATLVVRVLDGAGRPVAGAQVHVWPNVAWSNGYSGTFLDRTWSAVTDRSGDARIENLPPENDQGLRVQAEGHRIAGARGPRPDDLRVDLASGRTAELRVVLEPAGG